MSRKTMLPTAVIVGVAIGTGVLSGCHQPYLARAGAVVGRLTRPPSYSSPPTYSEPIYNEPAYAPHPAGSSR